MSVNTDQIGIMESDVRELRQLLVKAAAAQPLIDVSGGSASAAAKGLIAQMQTLVTQLDANRVLVFTDQWSFEKWRALANDYRRTLGGAVAEAANYSLAPYLKDSVVATASDVAAGAKEVKDAATSGTTWGVLAAVAVLILAWRLK